MAALGISVPDHIMVGKDGYAGFRGLRLIRRLPRRHNGAGAVIKAAPPMGKIATKPRTKTRLKTERPRLHKVILVNDDFTPREFVVTVLRAEFRMSEDQAYRVMMTAHRRGVCVVAVYARDIAETKATRATEAGRSKGYPLLFTTEPEE
jgi:ATP-dependent Clp protease adaptor protein ClpS